MTNGLSVSIPNGETHYIQVLDYVSDSVTLLDVPADVRRAVMLKDGSLVKLTRRGENTILTIPPHQRDEADTVIRLER